MSSKKKIGIITLHAIANYGGILQSYALQTVLKRMGYDVEKIERHMWSKQLSLWQKMLYYPYRAFKKRILRQPCVIKLEQHQYDSAIQKYNRARFTQPFIDNHINRKQIFSYSELDKNEYYAFIVGSDQIWRPQYAATDANANIRDAFLDFARDWQVKRIAYAASFGTDKLEYSPIEVKECGELLKRFDAVSVREKSGIQLCELLGRKDACLSIDPTMLLSKEDYCELVPTDYPVSDGDLLCYILDKSKTTQTIINYIAQKKGLKPFEVIADDNVTHIDSKSYYQPPVEKWLRGFMDAKFVVTDSFHACVFSIIFNKPFIVIANQQRGVARYQTLLKMFELENRMIFTYDEEKIKEVLDNTFQPNMENFTKEKNNSISFLVEHLK